jgi:hypothetical protein
LVSPVTVAHAGNEEKVLPIRIMVRDETPTVPSGATIDDLKPE